MDDISELAEESFIDLCSDDPLEKVLTSKEEETFSVDSKADEYMWLMYARIEIENVDEVEDDTSEINVDRYLKYAIDRQPSSPEDWDPEKVPKIELKNYLLDLNMLFSIKIPTP